MPRSLLYLATFAISIAAIAQAPLPPPLSYDCHRTKTPIRIDGKLDDPAWKRAEWTSDFVDIEGAAKPTPRFRTRAKMLWDDKYLYIAAEFEERVLDPDPLEAQYPGINTGEDLLDRAARDAVMIDILVFGRR